MPFIFHIDFSCAFDFYSILLDVYHISAKLEKAFAFCLSVYQYANHLGPWRLGCSETGTIRRRKQRCPASSKLSPP